MAFGEWKNEIEHRFGLWKTASASRLQVKGPHVLALALWLAVLGAVWLQPVAMKRRTLEARAERLEREVLLEETRSNRLSAVHDALKNDPTAIEREARRIGYGRQNEQVYPLSENARKAGKALMGREMASAQPGWASALAKAAAPMFMALILGVVAILFFAGLRVDDYLK